MMLENETILPNTNFTEFNPKIEGSERLQVPVRSMAWPTGAEKRICMSNFGKYLAK
jgi:acyl transferase domain-containing protein